MIDEVLPKLLSITEVFLAHRKDDLICKFEGASHWNFYDWSENLERKLYGTEEATADLAICLFLTAQKTPPCRSFGRAGFV